MNVSPSSSSSMQRDDVRGQDNQLESKGDKSVAKFAGSRSRRLASDSKKIVQSHVVESSSGGKGMRFLNAQACPKAESAIWGLLTMHTGLDSDGDRRALNFRTAYLLLDFLGLLEEDEWEDIAIHPDSPLMKAYALECPDGVDVWTTPAEARKFLSTRNVENADVLSCRPEMAIPHVGSPVLGTSALGKALIEINRFGNCNFLQGCNRLVLIERSAEKWEHIAMHPDSSLMKLYVSYPRLAGGAVETTPAKARKQLIQEGVKAEEVNKLSCLPVDRIAIALRNS